MEAFICKRNTLHELWFFSIVGPACVVRSTDIEGAIGEVVFVEAIR